MKLLQREPEPPLAERVTGPNTDLDHQILRLLPTRPEWLAGEIVAELPGVKAQDVWRRLGILASRGLVSKTRTPALPRRGPGSYLYSVTPFTGSGTDDGS